MEPRAIAPQDIRVGDRVRAERTEPTGDRIIVEFTVVSIDRLWINGQDISRSFSSPSVWTLLDRPEPPREVGSRWAAAAHHVVVVVERRALTRRARPLVVRARGVVVLALVGGGHDEYSISSARSRSRLASRTRRS